MVAPLKVGAARRAANPVDRSQSVAAPRYLAVPGTSLLRLDQTVEADQTSAECRLPGKSSTRGQYKCDCSWGSVSSKDSIGWPRRVVSSEFQTIGSRPNRRKARSIIRKVWTCSRADRLPTSSTELSPTRVTSATGATKHFDWFRRTPIQGRIADGDSAATTEFD